MSLLCRADIKLDRTSCVERLTRLHISSPARFSSPDPDLVSDKEEEFARQEGPGLATTTPFVKVALRCLEEAWPQAIPFDALVAQREPASLRWLPAPFRMLPPSPRPEEKGTGLLIQESCPPFLRPL